MVVDMVTRSHGSGSHGGTSHTTVHYHYHHSYHTYHHSTSYGPTNPWITWTVVGLIVIGVTAYFVYRGIKRRRDSAMADQP